MRYVLNLKMINPQLFKMFDEHLRKQGLNLSEVFESFVCDAVTSEYGENEYELVNSYLNLQSLKRTGEPYRRGSADKIPEEALYTPEYLQELKTEREKKQQHQEEQNNA